VAAAVGSIARARADYGAALAANPLLPIYPFALSDVLIEPPESPSAGWRVRDRRGYTLPLPARFAHGWRLLSLAAGRPLALFGEWDGATFTPLSVHDGREWRAMAAWRGIP
jgi:hypothetical protein